MINGRLGSVNKWAWCSLAFVFGLVFTQCAYAEVFPTQGEASAACQTKLDAIVSTGSIQVLDKECRYEPVPSIDSSYGSPIPETFGLYRCQARVRRGNFWSVEMCGSSPGSLTSPRCTSPDSDECQLSDMSNATSIAPLFLTLPSYFLWREGTPEKDCSEATEFDSRTLSADTPNGTGLTCYQECQYSVSFWYNGTYPSGYLEYTFSPSGLACQEGDEDAITDPPDLDDEPLDLDPEDGGVDPGPDPGDGDSASSGGGTCDVAPQCTGDSLQCNILFQTWATRCAVEGEGDGEGDGLGESLDGIADGLEGVGDQIGDLGDQLGARSGEIFGDGEDVSGSIPGLGALNTGDKVFDSDTLDQSGFGMPRSCPAILTDSISFSFFGNQYDLSFDMMCDLLELVGQLLVVLSAFVGVRILLRSVS